MVNPRLFRHAGARNTRKNLNIQQLGDPSSNLVDVEVQTWTNMKPEERTAFIEALSKTYHRFVSEFYELANDCVERYDRASGKHTLWRRLIIIGTGVVAIINLFAANLVITDWAGKAAPKVSIPQNLLPIAAAVAALALTVLANLESFYNFAERAQGYRESRELFLDAARESQRVWEVYVEPFGSDPSACTNAMELYRRVVSIDRELRTTFKELTKTPDSGKGASSHGT